MTKFHTIDWKQMHKDAKALLRDWEVTLTHIQVWVILQFGTTDSRNCKSHFYKCKNNHNGRAYGGSFKKRM